MAILTELQAFREKLLRARMSGVREVRDQNGETLIYKSDGEMTRALAALDAEIAKAGRKPPHTILFKTSKGL